MQVPQQEDPNLDPPKGDHFIVHVEADSIESLRRKLLHELLDLES